MYVLLILHQSRVQPVLLVSFHAVFSCNHSCLRSTWQNSSEDHMRQPWKLYMLFISPCSLSIHRYTPSMSNQNITKWHLLTSTGKKPDVNHKPLSKPHSPTCIHRKQPSCNFLSYIITWDYSAFKLPSDCKISACSASSCNSWANGSRLVWQRMHGQGKCSPKSRHPLHTSLRPPACPIHVPCLLGCWWLVCIMEGICDWWGWSRTTLCSWAEKLLLVQLVCHVAIFRMIDNASWTQRKSNLSE